MRGSDVEFGGCCDIEFVVDSMALLEVSRLITVLSPQVPSACSPSVTCTGAAPGLAASAAWPPSVVRLLSAGRFGPHVLSGHGLLCARGGGSHCRSPQTNCLFLNTAWVPLKRVSLAPSNGRRIWGILSSKPGSLCTYRVLPPAPRRGTVWLQPSDLGSNPALRDVAAGISGGGNGSHCTCSRRSRILLWSFLSPVICGEGNVVIVAVG